MLVTTPPPLLAAATPDDWITTHLARYYQQHHSNSEGPSTASWVTIREVLADDAAHLRRVHAGLLADESVTANAAAKWVTSWYPGVLAGAVGFTLAMASAGLLVDGSTVRLRLHPDGWIDQVDPVGAVVVVAAGHPWAGLKDVRVVPDEDQVARLAAIALANAAEPLVQACRSLARVGRTSLWAEVADGFGLPMLMQPDAPVDRGAVRRLQWGLRAEGAPWRRVPDLRIAENGCHSDYLGRKAGCCLAYQCPAEDIDPQSLDDRSRAFEERFPTLPNEPRYCSTCSLRELSDCEARQASWLRSEREARCSTAATG